MLKALDGVAIFLDPTAARDHDVHRKRRAFDIAHLGELVHAEAQRFVDIGVGKHGAVDRFGRERNNARRRIAGGKDRHRLARNVPAFEREKGRRLGGAADGEDADFFADQIFRFANLFGGDEAIRESC